MTGSVPFWLGVSKAFFVLDRASLHGKREQIKVETLAGILANLCFSRLGEVITSRERSARPQKPIRLHPQNCHKYAKRLSAKLIQVTGILQVNRSDQRQLTVCQMVGLPLLYD